MPMNRGVARSSRSVAAFDPTDGSVPGLQAWFSGLDASQLFDAAAGGSAVEIGGTVKRWEDSSGNGRHLNGTVAAPTRSADGVAFSNAGGTGIRADVAQWGAAVAAPYECWVSMAPTDPTPAAQGRFLHAGAVCQLDVTGELKMNAGGTLMRSVALWPDALLHVFHGLVDGAASEMWVDEVSYAAGNAGTNAVTQVALGTATTLVGNHFDGTIRHVLVYAGEMSAAARTAVYRFLVNQQGPQ